ncbi:MAG: hypothetical protein R3B09_12820 [Nannocystaceae bacterium]
MTALDDRRTRGLLAAAILVLLVVVAQGLGSLYPISRFEMYAAAVVDGASRIGVRDAAGRLREVELYDAWSCDAPIDGLARRCVGDDVRGLDYLDDAAERHILAHPGEGAEAVALVRRIWRFTGDDAAPAVDECEIARCRVDLARDAPSSIALDMLPSEAPR